MNDSKNKIDLARVISKKTKLEENTTEAFINQFFFVLSESIINNPSTKIDGLGIFRIIKSSNGSKILFLKDKAVNQKSKNNIDTSTSSISDNNNKQYTKNQESEIKTNTVNTNQTSDKTFSEKDLGNTLASVKRINLDIEGHFIDTKQSEIKKDVENDKENSILSSNNRVKNRVSPYKKTYIDTASDNSNPPIETEDVTIIEGSPLQATTARLIDNSKRRPIIKEAKPTVDPNITKQEKTTDNQTLFENKDLEPTPKKKNIASSLLLGIISLLSIILVVFIIYLMVSSKPLKQTKVKPNTENNTKQTYKEIAVFETSKYSFVIIPNQDTPIENISEYYYGDKVFWPYIYYANIDFIGNDMVVLSGSVVKIPKLIIDLVEYRKGTIQKRAEKLGNEIVKNKK